MANELGRPEIKWKPAGLGGWVIQFGEVIDPEINKQVHRWSRQINEAVDLSLHATPAFCSMNVSFNWREMGHDRVRQALLSLDNPASDGNDYARRWHLPCCYDDDLGLDLADTAKTTGLSVQEVVRLHSSSVFFAYALGFMPGFAYMGGLPDQLSLPRLTTPRTKVPKSSVAITGNLAGVYPFTSPGGWRILGRTPLTMFDPNRGPAAIIEPGDEVQFQPISRAEFDALTSNPPDVLEFLEYLDGESPEDADFPGDGR